MGPGPEQVQISDAELIRAITQGEEQAFASLYHRYSSTLFGFLLRILNSNAEAEDVLQEVFVHVWQHAADFDEKRGRVFTWLATIARSRAIDRLRSMNSRGRTETLAAQEKPAGEISNVMDDALRMEQQEILRDALASISEEQRSALLLSYFEGLSQSEIAERMGKPLGTVKTRMRDGLRKLRDILHKRMKKGL